MDFESEGNKTILRSFTFCRLLLDVRGSNTTVDSTVIFPDVVSCGAVANALLIRAGYRAIASCVHWNLILNHIYRIQTQIELEPKL